MYGFSFPDILIPCHSNKLLRLKSELRGEGENASAPLTAKKNFTNSLFPLRYQEISTSSIPIQPCHRNEDALSAWEQQEKM